MYFMAYLGIQTTGVISVAQFDKRMIELLSTWASATSPTCRLSDAGVAKQIRSQNRFQMVI